MKTKEVKVSELSGSALDWCVALAYYGESKTKNGQPWFRLEKTGHVFYHTHENGWRDSQMQWFHPSSNWTQAGPIIEKKGIYLWRPYGVMGAWSAKLDYWSAERVLHNDKPLTAAMQCYVASELGSFVSVPVELLEA